jgi:hypothetical protein
MPLELEAVVAARSGDSDVVRTSAVMVANATARWHEESNPFIINISGSLSCCSNLQSRGFLELIKVKRMPRTASYLAN